MTALPLEAPPDARRHRDPLAGRAGAGRPLLAVLAVAFPLGVAAAIAIARHPTIVLGGDFAFVEQAVVDAEHGRQLLGSVDRFGVAHLGPAHYYLLAPVYAALGNHAYALAVGSLVLIAVAAGGIVAVAARRGGPGFALAAAVVLVLYLHAIGDERLREPWGPWAIMMPTVLFAVLAAAWAAGSRAALLGALLTGTFIVQTHVSTPPTLAAILLVAWLVRKVVVPRAGPSAPRARSRELVLLGALGALLVLAWVPPLIQQVTGHPGNLTLLYRFLRHPHGGFDGTGFPPAIVPAHQDLSQAVSGLGLELSVFPTGRSAALLGTVQDAGVLPTRARLLLVVLYAVLAVGLVALAHRRRDRFALALGAATLVSMATAVLSFTRIAGPFFDYLISWATALPVVLWLGWAALADGWLRSDPAGRRRRAGPLLAAGAGCLLVAASVTETVALARLPSLDAIATPQGADPTLAPAADLVRADLARSPARPLLRIVDLDTWPVAAAVGNQLLRHDQPAAVAGAWLYMFGDAYRPTGAERVEYSFADATGQPPPPPATRLGRVGGVAVYRRDLPG